jgi:heptaprenyl diphosphate synthase
VRIGLLAGAALVVYVAESALPRPFPWMRLGLANALALTTLIVYGLRAALGVTVFRAVAGSLLVGGFMSPSFAFSMTGGLAAVAAMAAVHAAAGRLFSPIGISVVGALAHSAAQLALARFVFIRSPGVLLLAPLTLLTAALVGSATGLAAWYLAERLGGPDRTEPVAASS